MSINLFVLDFLKQFDNHEQLCKQWESVKNQKKLKKTMKSAHTKDPNIPKRGKSGFLFFCDKYRPILLEESKNDGTNNAISAKQVVSKLGILWQKLKTENNVEEYENMSKEDRGRYKIEMKKYKEKMKEINKQAVIDKKTPKVKSKKVNPFDVYVKSKGHKIKEKNPLIDDVSVLEILKEKWKNLSIERKNKYNVPLP